MSQSPVSKKGTVRREPAHEDLPQGQIVVMVYDEPTGQGKIKNVPGRNQGIWKDYTASASPTEIWVFPPGHDPLASLGANPHIHGSWGYKPGVLLKDKKSGGGKSSGDSSFLKPNLKPDELWFFAPNCEEYPEYFTPQGIWTFPMVKTNVSQIAPEAQGFLKVGDSVKTNKLDVGGSWKMLYKRPGMPGDDDDDDQVKGPGMKSRSAAAPKSPVKKAAPVKKIKVHVRAPDGSVYALSGLLPTDTIDTVKEQLEPNVDIPKSKQKLVFEGTTLRDNNAKLKDLGVKNGSTLELQPSMTLYINHEGQKVKVGIEPFNTIKELEQKLSDDHGLVPGDHYDVLEYQTKPLDRPHKTLEQYKIPDGATLDAIQDMPMQIVVQTASGKQIPLAVQPNDSLRSVKIQVKDETGTPVPEQRLIYKGQVLNNDKKTLEQLKIPDGATLQLEGMLIYVQDPEDNTFELDVEPTDTIKKIKMKLYNEQGILQNQQRLSHDETMLDNDNMTLRDYQIPHKATLHLEPMQITVYNVRDDTTVELAADPGDTIADVKDMVYVAEGIPNNEQRLTFKNKVLGDATSLKENRIGHGATLHLEGLQIVVEDKNRKKQYLVDVEYTDTIEIVKEKLEEQEKIKKAEQHLIMDDVELEDFKTLRELEIQHKETLVLAPMQIYVRTPQGKVLSFIVEPTDKVRQVMKKITDATGIPKYEQRIFFGDQELDDAYKLSHYHIVHKSTLEMTALQIFVRDLDDEVFDLEVEPTTTVEEVKQMIEETTGIASGDQRLFYNEEKLHDRKTMRDSRIRNKSTLELQPMELNVKTPDGTVLTLSVDPYDTIAVVKKKVEAKSGIPAKSQRLLFAGNELDDAPTLSAYGLQHGNTLDLGAMEIDIKDWSGKTFSLSVTPSEPLGSVKAKIEDVEGVPVDEQYLLFQKDLLEDDDATLADYKIKHKSTLHLDRFKIVVETPRGKFLMDVEPTTTVDEIKTQVSEKVGIPIENQNVGFDGEELDGPTTISEAGIEYRDTVEVGMRAAPKQDPTTPPDSPERPTYTVTVGPWQSPFDYKPKGKIKRPKNGVRAKKQYNQLSDFYATAVNPDSVGKFTHTVDGEEDED